MVPSGCGNVRISRYPRLDSKLTRFSCKVPTGNTLYVLSGHIASVTCGRFTPDGR